ncbi:MAG: ABC transporter permease, partial [Oscillospiraceae bacterium]|nr:ABC transporter permease [Oscillospiraceae bacterium]
MLTKKMLRDMGRHKTQFLSIFLMAFLAIYIYTGVGGEWRGLVKSADDYYAETNLADVWLYGNGFSDGQVEAILSVPGVTSAERRLEMTAVADLDGTPKVDLMFVESSTISAMYLTDGFPFDIDDANGVWLSKRFADARGIAVGDTLKVIVSGMTFEKTIRGLVYSPEQVYEYNSDAVTEDFSLHGFAYLSEKAFPVPAMFTYSSMMITGESSEADIDTALDGKYRVYLARKDHPSVSTFAAEFDQHKMMGDVFPVVFLLIALLTMMTTMTRLVNNQRIQIGTLKALGFTKGSILRHYVSYGFWLTLLGAVTGLIAGPITLPRLFYPSMSAFYTVPTWKPAYSAEFILMAAAIVALSTAVCWYSCAKLLRDTPADTLRSKTPKSFKHGFLERAKIWGRLGFNAQWNIRDASRNPARSVMAVIGVFGCTILVVCAFAMNDATNDLKAWQFE